jgi:amiloride-sensitive sodium channel
MPTVFIHSPFKFPLNFDGEEAFLMSRGNTVEVLITPEVVTTDESFRNKLTSHERQCFMDGERKLKFFKFYSRKNCEMECMALRVVDECGCAPFDVIRSRETKVRILEFLNIHVNLT